MRFEHDIYDVDVYSLCESVYYSCNNDEYDYVLECINNWIYNNYNDNILLEDIVLNETISYNHLRNLIKRKFHKLFPGEDFNTQQHNYLGLPASDPISQFFSYTDTLLNRDFDQNKKNLLKFHPESDAAVMLPSSYWSVVKNLSPEEIQQAIDAIDITPNEYDKRVRADYRKLVGDKPRPIVSDEQKQRNRQAAEILKTEYYPLLSKMKTQYGVKKISELPPDVQNTLSSIWNKAKETETNTQPNTPPKQDKPIVISNDNNQSRLSRATTWMKNNKGKTALGVGLGAAAIGGSIYAYKRFKNRPRSVIAKRIQALRGIYHKFMINAQRNPKKANLFKRVAAKILSVIDKLLHYLQNTADGR